MASAAQPQPDPAVGLCSVCRHARHQPSAGGSGFWRCLRAATDPAFLKYPPLPVQRCPGHERPQEAPSHNPGPATTTRR